MNKKRILLLVLIVIVLAGLIASVAFVLSETAKLTGLEMENLRDQLKIFLNQDEASEKAETNAPETAFTEETVVQDETAERPETESTPETEYLAETKPAETEPVETKPAEPTLDFVQIQQINPDICAWIEIAGTKVDYPVLQSPYDDSKYLTTAHDGSYYVGGSLFTQASYNSTDFNDPVTIIYGHTMVSGILFGQLQSVYSSSASFKEHSEIKLYLPDEVRYYTVFAAVPYEKYHILHLYDFSNNYWYNNFFKNVRKIRDFRANFNDAAFPKPGERVLILSTCLNEDSTKRFLIMAILQDDLAKSARD